ncbi:Methylenetetrahydrofolate reductase 1 [Smittium culicis]|uniref:Methylenetetrahydrofolate reductase 1 n=2 Tax=Smittium culicis TaxID=133412 RepID=A0A1R1XGN6_9FUNG|nr:Methylenetetrahydrofolate reductase 1 [Smittium culicis]
MANLGDRLSRMKSWNPLFSTVTWGTGSSDCTQSIDFSSKLQNEFNLDAVLHLTCSNMSKELVDNSLKTAKSKGIRGILALRGDIPLELTSISNNSTGNNNCFKYASDLVEYIKSIPEYSEYFTIGVAGFPEGYTSATISETFDSATNSSSSASRNFNSSSTTQLDKEKDELKWLSYKVSKGADFILSQVFYSTDKFVDWYKKCRDYGITVPIIPTILPIQTYGSFKRIINLTKVSVPPSLNDQIELVKSDDLMVKQIGIDFCCNQISTLTKECNILGFHFSTLNLENSLLAILTRSGLLRTFNNPSDLSSLPSKFSASNTNSTLPVGGESATWDEYPNSRWGDARSPAFFNESIYGQSSFINTDQLLQWGFPKSLDDINTLFSKYISGDIPSLPWTSDNINSSNSDFVISVLNYLPKVGIWPMASQLAVDGAQSSDPEFGWGPANGYVYQRSFIEFFAIEPVALKILEHLKNNTKQDFSYYASKLNFDTNEPLILSNAVVNNASFDPSINSHLLEIESTALSWGVFPSSPVIQSALIDKLNFGYWSKEAIQLWRVWASQIGSFSKESKQFIDSVADSVYLINIVANDYKTPEKLFCFLREEF